MIPHNRPCLGPSEEEAALRVLRSGFVAQGKEVAAFEDAICAFLGLPEGQALALSSGTAALFVALRTLAEGGKRVAFPAYSCSALRHAAAFADCPEILLDSGEDLPHGRLPDNSAQAPELAIAVHLFGIPQALPAVAGLQWIEDCAHAFGARIEGRMAGLRGAAGIVSFYATKLITSGGSGGALFSSDRNLIEAARDFREFDQRRDRKARFNLQMNDLQAAIGREQLKRLPSFLSRRTEIFERYRQAGLSLMDGCNATRAASVPQAGKTVTQQRHAPIEPVRYRAVLRTSDPAGTIAKLKNQGVAAIVPIQDWELLGDPDKFPNARRWTRRTVSLPCYPSLSDADVDRIIRILAA